MPVGGGPTKSSARGGAFLHGPWLSPSSMQPPNPLIVHMNGPSIPKISCFWAGDTSPGWQGGPWTIVMLHCAHKYFSNQQQLVASLGSGRGPSFFVQRCGKENCFIMCYSEKRLTFDCCDCGDERRKGEWWNSFFLTMKICF